MDTRKLKLAAEIATPGPWKHWGAGGVHEVTAEFCTVVHWSGFDQGQTTTNRQKRNNAAFIAKADPATVLALIEERDDLLEAIKDLMYWDNGKPEWDAARDLIARIEQPNT